MGQYKSYKDSYLDTTHERLPISQDAIVLINQDKYPELIKDDEVREQLKMRKMYSTTYYFIFGRVIFSGVNKNKLARGALTWTPSARSNWYLCEATDDKELYEKKWYIYLSGPSTLSIKLAAHMNMQGKLSYESLI